MAPRRCVVQDCNRVADNELGISMHSSPTNGSVRMQWKRFVCQHRKNFNPKGSFGICSVHFTNDCFIRAVHIKGTERRIKPGSLPTVWKNVSVSLSERSRRMVSEFAFVILLSIRIYKVTVIFNAFVQLIPACLFDTEGFIFIHWHSNL